MKRAVALAIAWGLCLGGGAAWSEVGTLRLDGCDEKIGDMPVCKVVAEDLNELVESNNRGWAIAVEAVRNMWALARRVEELEAEKKAPPKCATVEVDPPKKPLPPLKKDREL